jgi:hypothetical protein
MFGRGVKRPKSVRGRRVRFPTASAGGGRAQTNEVLRPANNARRKDGRRSNRLISLETRWPVAMAVDPGMRRRRAQTDGGWRGFRLGLELNSSPKFERGRTRAWGLQPPPPGGADSARLLRWSRALSPKPPSPRPHLTLGVHGTQRGLMMHHYMAGLHRDGGRVCCQMQTRT